jgi:hypothetical protein
VGEERATDLVGLLRRLALGGGAQLDAAMRLVVPGDRDLRPAAHALLAKPRAAGVEHREPQLRGHAE